MRGREGQVGDGVWGRLLPEAGDEARPDADARRYRDDHGERVLGRVVVQRAERVLLMQSVMACLLTLQIA